MVSLGDTTGDGLIDVITYTVVDEQGEAVREVIDYEADGQADLRINFGEAPSELWYGDRWHDIEKRDGVRGIVVEGNFRELKIVDNRFVVKRT